MVEESSTDNTFNIIFGDTLYLPYKVGGLK